MPSSPGEPRQASEQRLTQSELYLRKRSLLLVGSGGGMGRGGPGPGFPTWALRVGKIAEWVPRPPPCRSNRSFQPSLASLWMAVGMDGIPPPPPRPDTHLLPWEWEAPPSEQVLTCCSLGLGPPPPSGASPTHRW